MRLKHSEFAVISSGSGTRVIVSRWDTREEAEADRQRRGGGFEVRLVDRKTEPKPEPKPIPEGVLALLADATPEERARALAIYS